MPRYKIGFGILSIIGFILVATLYFNVMSGTSEVSGSVSVGSSIEYQEGYEAIPWDSDMLAVNGYCFKGPAMDNQQLLSTKNKTKDGKLIYSFTAKEGMRHAIVVYIQLDHLTGDAGQTLELHFMTNHIKKGDVKMNFIITFHEVNEIKSIKITMAQSNDNTPKVFEYSLSEVPDIIKL